MAFNASNSTIQPYREGTYGTQRLFGKEWTFCDFAEKDGTQPNACPALTQVRRCVVVEECRVPRAYRVVAVASPARVGIL